jgi:hypothetical protein
MGCSCRGAGRAGGTTSSGATITGYQYTSPTGQVKVFLNINEAKAEMRKNVGGEIRQLTS